LSLRASELERLVPWLHTTLNGARLRGARASALSDKVVVLELRVPGRTLHLLLSVEPGFARLHTTLNVPPAPREPGSFVMFVRSHLMGSALSSIAQPRGERIVEVSFDTAENQRWRFLLTLFGAIPALHLVAPDGTLAQTLPTRHDGPRPGQLWHMPPPAEVASVRPPRDDIPIEPADMDRWLDTQWGHRAEQGSHETLQTALTAEISKRIKSLERRRAAIVRDMARTDEAPAMRHRADLLQSVRHQLPRGARVARVADWSDPDMAEVSIELDPARSLPEQIEHLYHTARRYERAEYVVLQRLQTTEQELDILRRAAVTTAAAEDSTALDRIRAELQSQRLLPVPKPAAETGRARATPSTRLPYHPFVASDGTRILVGRGSSDNDQLTFHVARGNDIWMHAMDWAGSHVVIQVAKGKAVSQRALEEAALLAAWFSKGKQDGVVTVQFAQRKYVRKPAGVAAGRVSVASPRTVDVRMDDSRLARVLATGPEGAPAVQLVRRDV
jgi:predicted ribosome quality control (RQC) complex YloA/Tae2 family protein